MPTHPAALVAVIEPQEPASVDDISHFHQVPAGAATPFQAMLLDYGTDQSRLAIYRRLDRVAGILAAGTAPEDFPWEKLTPDHLLGVKTKLQQQNLKPASVNAHMSVVKKMAHTVWRQGLMSAEMLSRIKDVRGVKGKSRAGRLVEDNELFRVIHFCQELAKSGKPIGLRDCAMLALCFVAGLRRSEAASVQVEDYDPTNGNIEVKQGKGNKDRITRVGGKARVAVNDWLEVRGMEPGPLLTKVRGRVIYPTSISGQNIYMRFRTLAAAAGVPHFCVHDGRRRLISQMWELGKGREAQIVAGHESIAVTATYDKRAEKDALATLDKIKFPY